MLVQRDEDAKFEVTTDKEKKVISAITSIFQSIKHSEDVVDASKSKVGDIFYIDNFFAYLKVMSDCNLTL